MAENQNMNPDIETQLGVDILLQTHQINVVGLHENEFNLNEQDNDDDTTSNADSQSVHSDDPDDISVISQEELILDYIERDDMVELFKKASSEFINLEREVTYFRMGHLVCISFVIGLLLGKLRESNDAGDVFASLSYLVLTILWGYQYIDDAYFNHTQVVSLTKFCHLPDTTDFGFFPADTRARCGLFGGSIGLYSSHFGLLCHMTPEFSFWIIRTGRRLALEVRERNDNRVMTGVTLE